LRPPRPSASWTKSWPRSPRPCPSPDVPAASGRATATRGRWADGPPQARPAWRPTASDPRLCPLQHRQPLAPPPRRPPLPARYARLRAGADVVLTVDQIKGLVPPSMQPAHLDEHDSWILGGDDTLTERPVEALVPVPSAARARGGRRRAE